VLVSGPIGDHGIAVMLAREQFGLRGDLKSDAASVLPIARELVKLPGLRFMRDPTRGGLATVRTRSCRAASRRGAAGIPRAGARVGAVGVRDAGYDPYFLACEGRIVSVIASEDADRALAAMQALPSGREAAIIGRVQAQPRA